MAPTDTDDDVSPPTPNEKPENPFIRFRRFADAQVGAVLQGIIGLPSAFSKQSSEANSRWTAFQNELRQREKTRADIGVSEVSETRNRHASDGELGFRGKMASDGSSAASSQPTPGNTYTKSIGGMHQHDIDLFSSLEDAMSLYFPQNLSNEVDEDSTPLSEGPIKTKYPWESLDDKKIKRTLGVIQSMIYRDLYAPDLGEKGLLDHEKSSVIPYVLFSPYSPLALSNMPTPSMGRGLHGRNRQAFPYVAAFEDLLLASHGRPMGFWGHASGDSGQRLASHFDAMAYPPRKVNPESKNEWRKVTEGLAWVRDLASFDILGPHPLDPIRGPRSRPAYFAKQERYKDSVFSHQDEEHGDMSLYAHEQLATWDALSEVGRAAMVATYCGSSGQQLAALNDEHCLMRILRGEKEKNQNDLDFIHRIIDEDYFDLVDKEPETVLDFFMGLIPRNENTPGPSSARKESLDDSSSSKRETHAVMTKYDDREQDSESRADQPISTTRTTEQTTNQSGTVETKVTIEKIFADGRRNVTITEHVELPPDRRLGVEEGDGQNRREGEGKTSSGNLEGMKVNKGGWFWN